MVSYAIDHYPLYLLVLLRMVAFIGTSPLMSVRFWPAWAKLGLAAFTALTAVPMVAGQPGAPSVPVPTDDPAGFILAALRETLTGVLLGFVATVLASAVSAAGQLVDLQIGLGAGALFDPSFPFSEGPLATVESWLFTLYFLGIGGLDGLMLAVLNSYRFIPVGAFHLPAGSWQWLSHLLGITLSLAVQLAAPLLAALLLTDVTFALLSRAVPQMNVFFVGLPIKLFAGLSLFAVWVPGMVYVFGQWFTQMFRQMDALLRFLGG